MKHRLILLFFGFALKSAAQGDSAAPLLKPESYIRLQYDNDFFSATDRYYTQGIQLQFIHRAIRRSPLSYTLIKLRGARLNYYGLHLQQDVYTPVSIRHEGIFYGERPFTAVFYLSHALTSIHIEKKRLLYTQLDLGVMGPLAKGEEEQKGIHKALNNIQPLGWENQLANAPVVNYSVRFEKGWVDTRHVALVGSAMVRLGTLYTDVGLGLQARAGIFNAYFTGLGLENDATKRRHKFKIYGLAKLNIRLVAYNATLQGGIGTSNVYALPIHDVSRVVTDALGGIVIACKRVSLQYSKTYITREFRKGLDHGWGSCVITFCF